MKLRVYHIVWIICIILAVLFFALDIPRQGMQRADTSETLLDATRTIAGAESFGGAFTLTDHHGNTVTETSWPDKYRLVYFGFTFCPDVCPLGLTTIANALDRLPKEMQDIIQPILVTVDPERDDAETLKQYVTLFNPNFIGLTGTVDQIEHMKKLYKVYAAKDGSGDEYMINHSAFTYFVAPDGTLIGLYPHETSAKEMAEQIETLLKK